MLIMEDKYCIGRGAFSIACRIWMTMSEVNPAGTFPEESGRIQSEAEGASAHPGAFLVVPNPKLKLMEQVKEVMRLKLVEG